MKDNKSNCRSITLDQFIDLENKSYVEEIDEVKKYMNSKNDEWEEIRYSIPSTWKEPKMSGKITRIDLSAGIIEQIADDNTMVYKTMTDTEIRERFEYLMVNSTGYDIKDDLAISMGLGWMLEKEDKK